jgi:hypothetical protein
MNLDIHRTELQKRLSDLQGQKVNIQAALDQTTTAIERTIGSLQMLDTLEQGNAHDREEVQADA